MDIHGDQIAAQFQTYGVPQPVLDFFAEQGIKPTDLDVAAIPAHGVAAVKELMAYTTGTQVVLAIAAIALGQMPEPVIEEPTAEDAPEGDDAHDDDTDDDGTQTEALDAKGVPITEGMRVVVRTTNDDGTTIEGGGTMGEVESIERRGDRNYVSIETDPDPGHTTGNLISIIDSNLEVLPV